MVAPKQHFLAFSSNDELEKFQENFFLHFQKANNIVYAKDNTVIFLKIE